MNYHNAGLYTRATILTWLLAKGLASPPVLVLLGLTLPDSRLLNGVAGIGLTLANIADLIPYLGQPAVDTTHANDDTLVEISTPGHGALSSNGSCAMQVALPSAASVVSGTVSPREGEHVCAASDQSGCLALTESLNSSAIDHQDARFALPAPLLPLRKEEDAQVPVEFKTSPPSNSAEMDLDTDDPIVLDEQAALFSPLPAPDTIEDALFTTSSVLSINDPRKGCSTSARVEDIVEQDSLLLVANFSSTLFTRDTMRDVSPVASAFNVNEGIASTPTKTSLQDHLEQEEGATSSDGPLAQRNVLESAQMTQRQEVKQEMPRRLRPESLVFIPQSVIRRFPSAPLVSATPCYGHQALGYDYQAMSVPPAVSVDQQSMLLEEGMRASTWASVTLGERSRPPQLFQWEDTLNKKVDVTAEEPPIGKREVVLESVADRAPLEKVPTPLLQSSQGPTPEVHTLQLESSHRQHRHHSGRRLGVLARAALRNRRYKSVRSGDSRSTDSDSESDSDSQYSGSSSGDESMLPRILGSDLIAAIDANSEWELNLYGSRKTAPPLPDIHEDFPPSEDSTADVSLLMHGPSTIDASDTGVRAPATSRSLTYEDIQNWATGVVHTCFKRVHRNHAPIPARSPSQASEVCAERPLIPGVFQCPLAGHHCKLGASTAAETPALKIPETPASMPQPVTQSQPTRKPLVVRNIRDIPEFVPRQRPIPVVISNSVESPPRLRTRSMVQVTVPQARDAAGEVIARMESRVGFDTQVREEGGNGAYWTQPARGQLERHAERYRFRLA